MNIHQQIDIWIRDDGVDIFRKMNLPRDSRVVDFGCGYGEYTASASLYIHSADNARTKMPIRFKLYEEAHRILKETGILSIVPFELSKFRDKDGNKTKFTIDMLIDELDQYGFRYLYRHENAIHFEKYHSPYQWKIHNNDLKFEDMETGPVLCFGLKHPRVG